MKPIVSAAKCNNYDFFRVKKAVRKSLAPLGSIKAFVKPGQKVLLKPNVLGSFEPEDAVTTHPAIVKAVLQIVKEAGAMPFVAESSGIGIDYSTTKALVKSGIKAVAEEENVACFPLETKGFRKINGARSFFVSKAFLRTDVVISLPKLKTHALTLYTGAIKNSFAIVPASERQRAHNCKTEEDFCGELIEVFLARKPELAIMDAIVAMEGTGPVSGKQKKLGVIIASNDAVALDAIVCNSIGFGEINTLKKAREKRAGETRLEKIKVLGKIPRVAFAKPFITQSKIPLVFVSLFHSFTAIKPVVDNSKCVKCGVCTKHCPAHAIELKPFPKIDGKKCICCFCCSELCPEQAIRIEMGIFGKTLSFIKSLIFSLAQRKKTGKKLAKKN